MSFGVRRPNPLAESDPLRKPWVSELPFDLSNGTKRYAMNARCRSIVLDFVKDRNGNLSGTVDIFIGDTVNGMPWTTISNGQLLTKPVAISTTGTFITIVPSNGAKGTLHITFTEEPQGVFRSA